MEPVNEATIRRSFINCSRGEATRIKLPSDFRDTPWPDLDFYGWVDPSAPLRAAIVVPGDDGVQALMLRKAEHVSGRGAARSGMCQVCLTSHASSGISLFTAALTGASGRNGNSVGDYLCSDLACSLYLRGKRQPKLRLVRHEETLTVEEKVERAMAKLRGFTRRVAAS
jgi:hypothetical protein